MKLHLVVVLCLPFVAPVNYVHAQANKLKPVGYKLEFKVIQYQLDETIWHVSKKIIEAPDNKTDLFFYARYFNCPYNLPPKFTDPQFKNTTNTVWSDPKGEKTSYKNKRYTFTYDSLARLVKYVYSGCMVCNDMPYTYQVAYDDKGLVMGISGLNTSSPNYKFYYDADGNVKQVDQLEGTKLYRQVIRTK